MFCEKRPLLAILGFGKNDSLDIGYQYLYEQILGQEK